MRLATPLLLAAALLVSVAPASGFALRNTPGLSTITVHEVSFGTFTHSWPFYDDVLFTRLPGTLGPGNADFTGNLNEFYDIFYSDADGNPDPIGQYLTVECDDLDPNDGGGNIAELQLDFSNGNPSVYACNLTSLFLWGSQSSLFSAFWSVDGDLNTFSTLGSSFGAPSRLRLTFGFDCHPTSAQGSTWGRLKSLYR
ncbi:MAG: hypothetical protein U0704_07405 [Candidatus Eisenbacteria bacterium]